MCGRWSQCVDQGTKILKTERVFIPTTQRDLVGSNAGRKTRWPPELRGSQLPFTLRTAGALGDSRRVLFLLKPAVSPR